MINNLFDSVISLQQGLDIKIFMLCLTVSLVLGFILASIHMVENAYSKNFVLTLALLPASVSIVINMVNGNIGTGVAIAGAFSLVRFRSEPGTSREIISVFLAMAIGLACGMGYLGYAIVFTLIMALVLLFYLKTPFGQEKIDYNERILKITIPENLNFYNVFQDVFEEFTNEYTLISSKTSNMGTMYKLTYDISLKDVNLEKEFIDQIRIRNANLEVASSLKKFEKTKL